MEEFIDKLFDKIEIENGIRDKVALAINAVVVNLTSIASTIALLDGSKLIKKEHIDILGQYIHKSCGAHPYKQAGGVGAALPSEYYGNDSGSYHTNPVQGVTANQVDFDNNIARPAMGPISGGGKKLSKLIKLARGIIITEVKNTLKSNSGSSTKKEVSIKIEPDAKENLYNIILSHIECFINEVLDAAKLPKGAKELIKKGMDVSKKLNLVKFMKILKQKHNHPLR